MKFIVVFAGVSTAGNSLDAKDQLGLWKQQNLFLDLNSTIEEMGTFISNKTVVDHLYAWMKSMNNSFNHSHLSFIQESMTEGPPAPSYSSPSGNPQCDVSVEGPRIVQRVIPAQQTNNPMNNLNMPKMGFDMTQMTTDMLNKAQSTAATQTASAGVGGMVATMMVMNMVQSTASSAAAVIPMGIPPPVWNLRPFPCLPMITGSNCFGSVMYPITFSDSMNAYMSDSILTSVIKQFRSMFKERAGLQPNLVYQKCYKAYMSMMCSSIFPMCTNPQGQNEFIPLIGRVPMCVTSCLAVLAICPGFTLADIQGPCSSVSLPPFCSQAIYLKDDLEGQRTVEDEIAEKINSKCHNYDPEVDAGQDPFLYEEEPVEKLFHSPHEMQAYIGF